MTFAHVLHNTGFADADELATLARAWRRIYETEQPDLILLDHSPVALLASRGLPVRRATIGTGFCCPPDRTPMPHLRPWLGEEVAPYAADEARVLATANAATARLPGAPPPPLAHVTQMYGEVDETFLTTFRELDHYPQREGGQYWGTPGHVRGTPPEWPAGEGKRVFAYLKSFPALPALLEELRALDLPSVVYVEKIDPRLARRFEGSCVAIAPRPLDIAAAARGCDLAILNGTHASTVAMLLAGRPTLHVPLFLEQSLCVAAVERLGAGLAAHPDRDDHVRGQLRAALAGESCREAAAAFAARYASFDAGREWERLVARVEALAGPRSPTPTPFR
jgi:UDP:flavonoid glycosyltransferase YjiC (YdhE family)